MIILKIAIVGCGGMAHSTHMPCILKYGGAEVISCADIDPNKAKSLSEKYNIALYFTDYNEMLEKTKPDAVVCLVSENAVAKVASDILKKYPVLLEKPPGKTEEETRMIAEASEKRGNINMVAFNRRFAPVYSELKELIRENGSGINYINYKFFRIKRHESNFEDTAIHAIDTVKFLAGSDFKRVEIKYQEMPELGDKIANYFIFFEFLNGIFATAEILVSTGELFEGCEIHTRGNTNIYRAALPMGHGIDFYVHQGFYNEHKHFYDCLKSGTDPKNGADTAVQSVAVCRAIKNRENFLVF